MWVADCEADGLLDEITKLHCFVAKKYKKDRFAVFTYLDQLPKSFIEDKNKEYNIDWYDLEELTDWINNDLDTLCIHNLFGYDLEAMRLTGYINSYDIKPESINGKPKRLIDTLSMSRALYPDRHLPKGCPAKVYNPVTGRLDSVGSHGLMAWGYRVANAKPTVHDWRDQPLEVYVHRCIEDVVINELALAKMIEESKRIARGDNKPKIGLPSGWKDALRINNKSDYLMCKGERDGILFDEKAAIKLRDQIDQMMDEIAAEVESQLPLRELPMSQRADFPQNPFKKDGAISSSGYNWLRRLGYQINDEAFDLLVPPAKPYKANGELSSHGDNFCIKNGVDGTDQEKKEFIKSCQRKLEQIKPLNDEDYKRAVKDLKNKVEPDWKEPMKISNQDDIKLYLFKDQNWYPTLWNTKDITRDENKRSVPEDIQEEKIEEYIVKYSESPYKPLIEEEMGIKFDWPSRKLKRELRRKARFLVTTPKLKDERGELCPSLESLQGEMAKKIVKWLSLRNRRSVIQSKDEKKQTGWLNNPRLKVDGRIGQGFSGVTNTNRYKHRTIVNLPKASPDVLLGKEMRSLFIAPKDHYILGYDGSNLEQFVAGCYAWIFDKGEYLKSLEGDSHCYTGDVEVLTPKGWVRFDNLKEQDKVAQYDKEKISFVKPNEFINKPYKGGLYTFRNSFMDLSVTPNHRMVREDCRSKKEFITLAKDYSTTNMSSRIIRSGKLDGKRDIDKRTIEFLVMLQADASYTGTSFRIEVGKENKKRKLLELLEDLKIPFSIQKGKITKGKLETLRLQVSKKDIPQNVLDFLDKDKNYTYNLLDLDLESKNHFLNCISKWDGWENNNNVFYSQAGIRRKSVEVVQTIASLCNRKTFFCKVKKDNSYRVTFSNTPKKDRRGDYQIEKKYSNFDGRVYCVSVPSGKILVRKNNKIVVSGNSVKAEAYSKAAGRIVSRGEGKGISYGTLYGAQAKKISAMLGISIEKAQQVIDAFWDTSYGLKPFKEALEAYWEATGKKYIRGIDGRKIYTRSRHSLVNAAFQSCGAILMSIAGCFMYDLLIKNGIDLNKAVRLAYIHDEYQYQVHKDYVTVYEFDSEEDCKNFERKDKKLLSNPSKKGDKWYRYYSIIGDLGNQSLLKAGRLLNMPVDFTAAYDVGKNLSETH